VLAKLLHLVRFENRAMISFASRSASAKAQSGSLFFISYQQALFALLLFLSDEQSRFMCYNALINLPLFVM